ncbi:hypothetical protein ASPWEDRAFT_651664 [Aspergillus wentii DTO 134E9]|uniref:RanBD1 domain-containing protein n=1 Tax=Aspergillus wentii DTO 134E9 TaxID=1073089 RepID=A0A1L9RB18_ASPWE|nr:uncharacterized protein ASPWEDRAFT_651664 [Aspergillus wentii DTO 134E9]KAI9934700.1 hypothetical protein MW887_000317 [Aspergillus wentii]OJJ32126.1 hypothetical protein ASPWEDRAFT_651664 [Aspergillus wentii DTO 134E9]
MDTKVAPTEDSQTSDNDGGERPVRRKLKETSITSVPQNLTGDDSTNTAQQEPEGGNSRSSSRGRKRSFDEEDEEMEKNDDENGHRRKRSRDSNYEDENQAEQSEQPEKQQNADSAERKILSPKKKRSRDQLDKEEPKAGGVAEKSDNKVPTENGASEKSPTEGEPEKKRHRDDSQERDSAPIKSAFTNTSAVSPFGSIGSSKAKEDESKKPVTSKSAFAASSLAAFSGSEQSPFGSIGGSTTSVFKSPAATESGKPATTGFAAAEGASPFASKGSSGFASLGSGFSAFSSGFGAASAKPTGGLTSFASPGPSSLTSTSKVKPFGAAEEEDENEEDEGETGPKQFEEDKTDERFFAREIQTGEEEEKTYFSCKAKLFQFSDKEWRERGIGTFKVNVSVKDGKEDKKAVRLIMRADGVLRVMLNTPIFKGMTVGDPSGNEPKSTKQIHLASLENGRSVPILLRTGSEDQAKELYHVVRDLLEEQ